MSVIGKREPATGKLNADEVHGSGCTSDGSQGGLTHQTVLLGLVVLELNRPAVGCKHEKLYVDGLEMLRRFSHQTNHLASPLPVPPGITPSGSLHASIQSSLSKIPFSTCVRIRVFKSVGRLKRNLMKKSVP